MDLSSVEGVDVGRAEGVDFSCVQPADLGRRHQTHLSGGERADTLDRGRGEAGNLRRGDFAALRRRQSAEHTRVGRERVDLRLGQFGDDRLVQCLEIGCGETADFGGGQGADVSGVAEGVDAGRAEGVDIGQSGDLGRRQHGGLGGVDRAEVIDHCRGEAGDLTRGERRDRRRQPDGRVRVRCVERVDLRLAQGLDLECRHVLQAGLVQPIELRRRQIRDEGGVERADVGVRELTAVTDPGANLVEAGRRERVNLLGCQIVEFGDGKVLGCRGGEPGDRRCVDGLHLG